MVAYFKHLSSMQKEKGPVFLQALKSVGAEKEGMGETLPG